LKVLSVTSTPTLQNSLKKMGKNPAITVVAKAEFPKSYIAQDRICFQDVFKVRPPFSQVGPDSYDTSKRPGNSTRLQWQFPEEHMR
jgi:hypothetical protein